MSLLVVGTVAFDAIETPFGKTDKILGGAATYISLAAKNFVPKVNVISAIGEDFPTEYLRMLENYGIHTKGIQMKRGEKTFFWSGKYHFDMNSRDDVDTQINVFENFDPIVPEEYQNCDFLMLGSLLPSTQKQVLERMWKRPKLVMMDTMGFWMDLMLPVVLENLKKVDVLCINESEARKLSEEYSLVKAAQKILKMGPKYLIIKKGEHGALLFNEKQIFFAPAMPLENVFDPTGAGDTFAGGFLGYLAQTRDISFENMKRALINASALASFTVEKFGTERLLKLTKEEVENRIQQFVNLVQFDIELENSI